MKEGKFLTEREKELSEALQKKEVECIELYSILDSKYTQIAELIKENSKLEEAIELLEKAEEKLRENHFTTLPDKIYYFLNKI